MGLVDAAALIQQSLPPQTTTDDLRFAYWDDFEEGSEGPVYAQNPWDTLFFGTFQIPGLVKVKAGQLQKKIDVQKAQGRDGGALVERGIVPGKFSIDVLLWTKAQWAAWLDLRPRIYRLVGKLDVQDTKKKKSATATDVELTEKLALPVTHPALNSLDITAAIIENITVPVVGSDPGTVVFTISCVHYLQPSKALAVRKPKGVAQPKQDPAFESKATVNKPKSPSAAGEGGPNFTPNPLMSRAPT